MSDIITIRLISSEWVIGKAISTDEGGYRLHKPRLIHIVPAPDQRSYVPILVPFDPISPDEETTIFERAVAAVQHNPNQQMVDKYLSETTDIEIVSSLSALGNFK